MPEALGKEIYESQVKFIVRFYDYFSLTGICMCDHLRKFQREVRDIFVLAWYLSIIIFNSTISRPPE